MKKFYTIALLLFSINGFSSVVSSPDTISYWQIYRGETLLEEGNVISHYVRVTLDKKKYSDTDTLTIKFFTDAPCRGCHSQWTIRSKKGQDIKTITSAAGVMHISLTTADLHTMYADNRSPILKVYFKENEAISEVLLFEFEFK